MSKVNSKLQVTIPKAIADQYGIHPGVEVEWIPAGESIRVVPPRAQQPGENIAEKLKRFDEATGRKKKREASTRKKPRKAKDRGWRREDLYTRGSPR